MAILIVGEKPSVSRAISSVVGANATKKGYTEGNLLFWRPHIRDIYCSPIIYHKLAGIQLCRTTS